MPSVDSTMPAIATIGYDSFATEYATTTSPSTVMPANAHGHHRNSPVRSRAASASLI